jgi:hypothetical protein
MRVFKNASPLPKALQILEQLQQQLVRNSQQNYPKASKISQNFIFYVFRLWWIIAGNHQRGQSAVDDGAE